MILKSNEYKTEHKCLICYCHRFVLQKESRGGLSCLPPPPFMDILVKGDVNRNSVHKLIPKLLLKRKGSMEPPYRGSVQKTEES